MSIAFTKDGKNYELDLDGSVKVNQANYGTWTTNEDNALQISPSGAGAVFAQPATWSTTANILSVTPTGGAAVDLLAASGADIDFRIEDNHLVVDALPLDDFSFSLTGTWSLTTDYAKLQLKLASGDTLSFDGGLDDTGSRFSWSFETTGTAKKLFALTFDGSWTLAKNPDGKGGIVLASFAFSYEIKGATTKGTFSLPVNVGVEPGTNKLLFTYNRTGSAETWAVAFAGKFQTKGGSLIGYSAEVQDDNGNLAYQFSFDFRGKISDGKVANANTLHFDVTIQGSQITLQLSGSYKNLSSKTSVTFSFTLNASTLTKQRPSITFSVSATFANGGNLDLTVKVDGSNVTVSLHLGTDIISGGSRKGTVYGQLDFTSNGQSVGVSAMFGITLN